MKQIFFAAILMMIGTAAMSEDNCERDMLECGFRVPVTVSVPLDACGSNTIDCKEDRPEAVQFCAAISEYNDSE